MRLDNPESPVTPLTTADRPPQGESAFTKGRRSGRPFARAWQAYALIFPGLLLYAIFVLYPALNTARYSLFEWTGFSTPTYIGLDNYIELVNDADFWRAIGNNIFFVIFYTIIPISLGLFLASIIARGRLRGMLLFRVGLFVPQVLSAVVVGIIWRWLFTLDGPINGFLESIGLQGRPWLGDFTFARYAVGFVGSWIEYGLCLILFIAGVQAIDEDLYDAARVFGANAWQQFRYVTLPGLRQQILVAFVLTFTAALRVFDLVYVLTGGGPGKQTLVSSLLIYDEAFDQNRAGYASAIAVVVGALILSVSAVVYWWQDRQEREQNA